MRQPWGEAPSARPRPYSPRYRRVLKHPRPTILRASLRSYKERSRHLCKVMGALIPRAQRRSRYERKRPLGRSVTECVRKGMEGEGFPPQKIQSRGTYSSISVEALSSSSEGVRAPKGDEGETLSGYRYAQEKAFFCTYPSGRVQEKVFSCAYSLLSVGGDGSEGGDIPLLRLV